MPQHNSEIIEYKHHCILSQPGEFRLMKLKQRRNNATPDNPLTVSFQHANLEEKATQYVALSYAWGTAKPTSRIQVKMGRKIYYKDITPTLEAALGRLQLGNQPNIIWADALCINQDANSKEKNLQVMQMDRIYNNAKEVYVWLGPSTDESDLAMKFIRRLGNQSFWELGPFVSNASYGPSWKAVRALISRPWFSRRWILQEILLARRATVLCGDSEVSWSALEKTLRILMSNLQEIKGLLRVPMEGKLPPVEQRNLHISWNAHVHKTLQVVIRELLDPFEGIPDSTVGSLVRWRERIVSRSKDGKVEKQASLEYLVSTLAGFQVSEPRDALYALCALAADGGSSSQYPIVVDYNKSILEIFSGFVSYCIETTKLLDIILRPWAPKLAETQDTRWPSWIRSSTQSEYTQDSTGQLRRINGAPFVGIPAIYSASGVTPPNTPITLTVPDMGTMKAELSITGISFDTITKIGDLSTDGTVPQDWHDLVGWKGEKLEDAPQDFLLALVGGREPDRHVVPHQSLLFYSSRIWKDREPAKPDFTKASELTEDAALGRVHAVAFGRRIFITEDKGKIGLGPSGMGQGDLVCILYGCSVPVILRPVANGSEDRFKIIGEAYIHSIMNGEALNDRVPAKTFVLV